jgi:hypothetical protein
MRRLVVCAILLAAVLWLAVAYASQSASSTYRRYLPIVAAPTMTPLPPPPSAPQWPTPGTLTPSAGDWDGPECITCGLP